MNKLQKLKSIVENNQQAVLKLKNFEGDNYVCDYNRGELKMGKKEQAKKFASEEDAKAFLDHSTHKDFHGDFEVEHV